MVEKDPLVSRRDVVRAGGAALTLATATSSVTPSLGPAFALDAGGLTATGVVFEDRSGGGRRQPGDPGIAGVLVSNGCDVVTVQRALGHANATTTLATYSHLSPTAEERISKAAEALMDSAAGIPADSVRTEAT